MNNNNCITVKNKGNKLNKQRFIYKPVTINCN